MKHMPLCRSRYTYQQYKRQSYTNSFRSDLRQSLKKYSMSIGEPESKILDMILSYCLENKERKNEITEMVRNYF